MLAELPQRIHAWLPGLAAGGVVDADAILSCLGPPLETLNTLEEVKGDKARLLPVSERASYLFGQRVSKASGKGRKKKK